MSVNDSCSRCAGPLPIEVSILDPVLRGRFMCHACAADLHDGRRPRIPAELPPVTPAAPPPTSPPVSGESRAHELEALPPSQLAIRVAELEQLVSSAQAFWRGELEDARELHRAEIAQKDVKIALLRRKLHGKKDSATRRGKGERALDPREVEAFKREVREAWRNAVAATGSLKGALMELQAVHGWNPRMVERVIADTDAELAEAMGITVARLREIEGRPPPRRESSDS